MMLLVLDLRLCGYTVLHLKLVLLMGSLAGCAIALLATKSVTSLLFEPIEVVVVLEALTVEQVLEDGSEGVVVWSLFESESSDLLHVGDELIWNLSAQFLQSHLALLSSNHFILLFLIGNFHSLPGQIAPHEIDQHKA